MDCHNSTELSGEIPHILVRPIAQVMHWTSLHLLKAPVAHQPKVLAITTHLNIHH